MVAMILILKERQGAYVELSSIALGDLDGDGLDEAAVDLRFGTGGTANWHYLYVFKASGNIVSPLAVMESGSRADGGLPHVEIAPGLLVLDFSDAERREGDCLLKGYIVRVRYQLEEWPVCRKRPARKR